MIIITSQTNSEPFKILVVCLGNMCRSPAGEYLLRYYYESEYKNLNRSLKPELQVESACLNPASSGMAKNTKLFLENKGIQTNHFISQSIPFDPVEKYDWILVMDSYMKEEIIDQYYTKFKHMAPEKYKKAQERIILFSEAAGRSGNITDPFGLPKPKYFSILNIIDKDSQKIILRLLTNNSLIG
mgnify:CR=1 FL=1